MEHVELIRVLSSPNETGSVSLEPGSVAQDSGLSKSHFPSSDPLEVRLFPAYSQPAMFLPPVPTFTRTRVCFLLLDKQPAPHKGVGILPEEPRQAPQDVPVTSAKVSASHPTWSCPAVGHWCLVTKLTKWNAVCHLLTCPNIHPLTRLFTYPCIHHSCTCVNMQIYINIIGFVRVLCMQF